MSNLVVASITLCFVVSDGFVRLSIAQPNSEFQPISDFLTAPESRALAVASTEEGVVLATSGYTHPVQVWLVDKKELSGRLLNKTKLFCWTLAFDSQAQRMTGGTTDGRVFIWKLNTFESPQIVQIGSRRRSRIYHSVFSPDGQRVAAACDGYVTVVDVQSGKAVRRLDGLSTPLGVAFSSDGRFLSSACHGGIRIWKTSDWQEVKQMEPPSRGLSYLSVAWKPDGRFLAAGRKSVFSVVFDVSSQSLAFNLSGPTRTGMNAIAWSPDGKQIAGAGRDNKIRIWNGGDGSVVGIVNGHKSETNHVCFLPDGKHIASVGDDQFVRIRHISSGKEVSSVKQIHRPVSVK